MKIWYKVKEVANFLNVSDDFIRTIICREEFKDFAVLEKPILIKYNDEFINLIKKYIKKSNIKRNHKRKETVRKIFMPIKYSIINSNILRGWTQTSIDCYRIGCDCSKCGIKMDTPCHMKQTVIELVKKFGPPNIERNDIL